MRRLLTVIVAGVVLGGAFVSTAEAGDRRGKHGRNNARHYRDYDRDDYKRYRNRVYYRPRDIVVIRDYYRPHYRPAPRVAHRYYRGGYLPPGWAKRMVAVPVYLEPQLVPVPYGYHRGFIDGHAVIYNRSGFILDIAAVF